MIRSAVIVPTYNQPHFLKLVLVSLRMQSVRGFQVIVADDGSAGETRRVVETMTADGDLEIHHVWQEDRGFRKPSALNRAVRAASAPYLIFNDGDCLAHRHFVRSHLEFAREATFLVGRTPRLSRRVTERMTRRDVEAGRAQRLTAGKVVDSLLGRSNKMEFGFYVGNDFLFRLVQKTKRVLELWGGNFSCWKSDYVRVNGFNEEILGWGKEDDEFGVRLRNAGLRPVSVANRAINFHLWHEKGARVRAGIVRNLGIKEDYERSGEYRCPVGYDGSGEGSG